MEPRRNRVEWCGWQRDRTSEIAKGRFMDLSLEQFGIDHLNPEQRLALIGLIWDSLPHDASFVPPEWHVRVLEQRLAAADSDPNAGESWEVVRARLSRKT